VLLEASSGNKSYISTHFPYSSGRLPRQYRKQPLLEFHPSGMLAVTDPRNIVSRPPYTDLTWAGLSTKKGSRASIVTIQGEMTVAKFFPKKGPNGTYSQLWMSRATMVMEFSIACQSLFCPFTLNSYHSSHSSRQRQICAHRRVQLESCSPSHFLPLRQMPNG